MRQAFLVEFAVEQIELLVDGDAALLELAAALHVPALEFVGLLVEVFALFFPALLLLRLPLLEVAVHFVAMPVGPVMSAFLLEGVKFLVHGLVTLLLAAF